MEADLFSQSIQKKLTFMLTVLCSLINLISIEYSFFSLINAGMGELRNFSIRVESESFRNAFQSSQIILSIIRVKNFHKKFFMAYYPLPSFYTEKLKTVVHK
jgi:hypothetical protein